MSRKIDFPSIGINLPSKSNLFVTYGFDSCALGYRFRKRLASFGLTDDEIVPMALYFYDALYHRKPWPPNPPFDAPEHYTGPTFDE